MIRYYSIPLCTGQLQGNKYTKTDAAESVHQHIRLLFSSMPGSFRFSPIFGSWLNKHHFHLPDKRKGEKKLEHEMKEKLGSNLRLLITKYEPRLALQDIDITVKFPKPGQTDQEDKGGKIIFEILLIGIINKKESFRHTSTILLK